MEPLVWLALPVLITAVAAFGLRRQRTRSSVPADAEHRREQLKRIADVLSRPHPASPDPTAGARERSA